MKAGKFILVASAAGAAAGIWALIAWAGGPPRADGAVVKELQGAMAKLRPLHKSLGKPAPADWLAHHDEPGQTFAQYLASKPNVPDERRRTITIQPLGDMTDAQKKIVAATAEFIGLYFNLPVKVNDPLEAAVVPAKARRTHPTWGDKQMLSTYILDDVLRPRLAKDAFAMIAFTAEDLWPEEGWNFVFGQASLRDRVGVWSLYRFGDPAVGEVAFRKCLLRTMKTGTHELGHMFSMVHCTTYECNMCGSNSLTESDRRPLALCPECLAKTCWATGADPIDRFRGLSAFCRARGLTAEADFYDLSLRALGGQATTSTSSAPAGR